MANQENNENFPQMEQQNEQEAHQHPTTVVLDNFANGVKNVAPIIDTGSANIPGRNNDRKLFVGGLSRETTEEDVRTYFTKYGTIESVKVKIDPQTQRSKGFAFIVFSSAESITKVTAEGEHFINNKKVDTQLPNLKQGKIFVGGITPELSEDDIKSYFNQFGNVVEMQMPFDKVKKQKKNFCFVVFSSSEVVEQLLKTPKVSIKNVEVDVKKAIAKSNSGSTAGNFPQQEGMQFAQDLNQNPTLPLYGGQNWNGNQMFGMYGYGQQSYGNVYPFSAAYNSGYQGGYGSYDNNSFIPNIDNSSGSSCVTGRGGAGRGSRRGTTRGGNNTRRGNGGRYQPY